MREHPIFYNDEKYFKNMKKSDLDSGMVVELRNGSHYLVLRTKDGKLTFSSKDDQLYGRDYNEDLINESGLEDYDIVKVYNCLCFTIDGIINDYDYYSPIWGRNVKHMTQKELNEKLGCEVVVVHDAKKRFE